MTCPKRHIAVVVIFLAATFQADAQKFAAFNHFIDSVLTARYWSADIDTNYITRPQTKWTLMGRVNVSGTRINAEGKEDGQCIETELTAERKSTVCLGVSYRGLSLNVAINPAKMLGKYHDYELNLRSYGKSFGFDVSYQDAHNFKGWMEIEGQGRQTLPNDLLKLRTLNVNAYCAFNHRRFSYPAAFAHSYIQRRSAGSFLLAASGHGQHGKVNGASQTMDFKITNIAIGAGYGYNFVPSRGWLLHLSALPTYIIYSKTSLKLNDTPVSLHHHFPEGIITCRSSIVKQIGSNKYAGLSMIYNFNSVGSKENLSVHNQKWLARLYFGVRL